MKPTLLLAIAMVAGCAATQLHPRQDARTSAPFEYVGIHFLVVPVRVNDTVAAKFILDTGIGVNIVSKALCKQIGCEPKGVGSGRRMSGQRVDFAMTEVGSITFAGQRVAHAKAAVFDFEDRNFGVDPSISGFLSLDFFRERAFTIDYRAHTITLEDDASLAARRARGVVAPLRLSEESPAVDGFAPMRLSDGTLVSILLDTGSPALTLDERFMAPLGITRDEAHVKKKDGSDETGYEYTRWHALQPVLIGISAGERTLPRPVKTMFQKIIHDGLIGDAYLRQFRVTFDLPNRQVVFAEPQATPSSN